MSKTIEEIKLEIANEKGRVSWGHLIQFTTSKWKDEYFTEVAQRYAQSQTQYLIKSLDAKQGQIDKLIKKYDRREIDFKSQTQELVEQNAELVEMLEYIFYKTNFQNHFPTTSIKVKNLLTKHNQLNKKK